MLPEPRDHRPARRRGMVVAALLLSAFIVALEATVISAVMPVVVSDIGGFHLYTWAFSIFLLIQTVAMPFYGRLADTVGRKPLFLIGTALFVAGSLGCGAAPNMPVLIFFRAVQALGGAGLTPIGATMMADITSPLERPRFLGYVSATFGLAAIAGPPVGALLVETVGWPFVFWMSVPIGAASGWIVARHFDDAPQLATHPRMEIGSTALFTLGAGATIFGLLEAVRLGAWAASPIILAGASVAAAILWRDRAKTAAIIPLYLLATPILRIANASSVLCGAVMMGVTVFLPLHVVGVLGGGPLMAGAALGIMSVTWTFANVGTGRLLHRLRYRPVAAAASLVILAGSAGLLTAMSMRSEAGIYAACGLLGIGLGIHSIVFTIASQSSVGVAERARSTTMFYFVRLVGQMMGAAILGGLLNLLLAQAALAPGAVQALMEPDRRGALAASALADGVDLLDWALGGVFLALILLSLATLLLALALPRHLRVADTAES